MIDDRDIQYMTIMPPHSLSSVALSLIFFIYFCLLLFIYEHRNSEVSEKEEWGVHLGREVYVTPDRHNSHRHASAFHVSQITIDVLANIESCPLLNKQFVSRFHHF